QQAYQVPVVYKYKRSSDTLNNNPHYRIQLSVHSSQSRINFFINESTPCASRVQIYIDPLSDIIQDLKNLITTKDEIIKELATISSSNNIKHNFVAFTDGSMTCINNHQYM
ncbi:6501_t:CDS:1, partial [Acaulospora colombiana]